MSDLKGLDDSPSLYEDVNEFTSRLGGRGKTDRGNGYRWEGTYTRFKHPQCRFSGKVRRIRLTIPRR